MVVGRSRSWTPCLNYESKSSKLQHDATAAATPCGVLVRTSTYTGISCGVEVSKSVLFLMLEHLYGHRAGANVRYGRRAGGSRVRAHVTSAQVAHNQYEYQLEKDQQSEDRRIG